MQPYDFTIHAADPAVGAMQGFEGGMAVRQILEARQEAEKQKAAQAQMNADLAAAAQNHSLLPGVMVKYPQLAEKLKHGWDAGNQEQQQGALDRASQVYSALQAGRPDIASQFLRDHATALRNGGNEDQAKLTETLAQMAEDHPEQLAQMTALRLAAVPGGDKVIDAVGKLGAEKRAEALAPSELTKAQAEAQSAAVAAKFAESKAVSDLNLTDANIKHLAADTEIARQNSRIAAMNASINKANSETERKKLDLQIQEATQKRDDLARTKVAEVRQGAATLDNLLNTVEQIKKHPALDAVVGPLAGKEMYPHTVAGMSPAGLVGLVPDAGERADVMALIEQLQSQASLSQLQSLKQASANGASGFGALSAPELKIVQEGIQSLKRTQSPESYRAKLDELSRLMKKNRDILADKFGVDPGKPDTPAAPGSRPPLSSFGGG